MNHKKLKIDNWGFPLIFKKDELQKQYRQLKYLELVCFVLFSVLLILGFLIKNGALLGVYGIICGLIGLTADAYRQKNFVMQILEVEFHQTRQKSAKR